MDWTEKSEHKKKIRKMAYRMLWADFKDIILGWKVLLVVLMYLGFFLQPFVKTQDFNFYGFYYFVVWIVLSLSALPETSFNYLPLSTQDIIYYLKIRTNHQIAWMVLISCLSAIILDVFGVEVFWERGLLILLFLLITVEWMFFMTLYSYSKPYGVGFWESSIPKGRKVRIVIYTVYSICALFGSMFIGMFIDYNENAKTKLLVILCVYLIMYIFRADAVNWVRFHEFNKTPRRSMWGNTGALKQK